MCRERESGECEERREFTESACGLVYTCVYTIEHEDVYGREWAGV